MKYFFALTILCFLLASAPAKADVCTQVELHAAEDAAKTLSTWKEMHELFQGYDQCDEGLVSERVSEADARLMSDHWVDMPKLLAIIDEDHNFSKWVVRHLDATDNFEDLRKINHNALTNCPPGGRQLCYDIHGRLRTVLQD